MGCVSHVQCMLTILTYILLNCVLIHHMVMHVFCTLISKAINWWHSVLYFTIPSSISTSNNAQIARLEFKGSHIWSHNKRHPMWKAHIPSSSQWFWASIIAEPDSISFKKESLVSRHASGQQWQYCSAWPSTKTISDLWKGVVNVPLNQIDSNNTGQCQNLYFISAVVG